MSIFIIIIVLIVIYAFYTEADKLKQAKDNDGPEFNPATINSEDTSLHPKNNNYNFSGYIKGINWHDTKDGQLQCWLKIVNDEQEKDMSKYIKENMKGTIQQYKAIEVNNYVHVTYTLRRGYNNIKELRVLKK